MNVDFNIDIEIKDLTPNWYLLRLHKRNIVDYLGWMAEVNQITEHERNSLVDMINSPDNENFELAITIMQTKKSNQNGNNVHSGNA